MEAGTPLEAVLFLSLLSHLLSFFLSFHSGEQWKKRENTGSPETWDQVTVLSLSCCMMFGNLFQLKLGERAVLKIYTYALHTGNILLEATTRGIPVPSHHHTFTQITVLVPNRYKCMWMHPSGMLTENHWTR